jgi:outer membrane protein
MKKLLLAILAFSVPALSADTGAGKTITPEDAVDIALSSNRNVAAARIRLESANKRANQAWGDLMPSIESSASASRQGAENGFASLSDGSNDVRVIQASLFVNPGVVYNSIKSASYEKAYAKEDLRRAEFQAGADAIRAYFSVIRAKEMVRTRKDSLSYLKTNYNDVQNLFRNGSVPKYELLQAEIQLRNAEPLLLDAMNAETSSYDYLNLALGTEKASYGFPEGPVTAPELKDSGDDAVTDALINEALRNRPEVIMMTIREQQSKHSVSAQKSMYLWPTFFLQGNYGFTQNLIKDQSYSSSNPQAAAIMSQILPKVAGDDEWQKTWQVKLGATFRWNGYLPFDKNSQKEEEEQLKSDEIAVNIAQIKHAVATSVKRNYLSLKTSRQTIDVKLSTIATAEEGLRIARESYRAGIIKNSELLSAEASLSSARASYIDSIYTFYVSLAELRNETGANVDKILFKEHRK